MDEEKAERWVLEFLVAVDQEAVATRVPRGGI
jgi:hypothetical protein